mgnify:CR=1 FL=1
MRTKGTGEERDRNGTQTVSRVLAILRAVAAGGSEGRRLSEIAEDVGLHTATTHRIASALAREGMLDRGDRSKAYRIGSEIAVLGVGLRSRASIEDFFEPAMTRLAELTADTIFLSARSGLDAVCISRREGTFPIRTLTLNVGDRRPLGIGAGSLALLAFAEEKEAAAMLKACAGRYARFGKTERDIAAMVENARRLTYALNDGRILPDMTAVALPLHAADGRIVAAISVAAINARMAPARIEEIVATMREEIIKVGPLPSYL